MRVRFHLLVVLKKFASVLNARPARIDDGLTSSLLDSVFWALELVVVCVVLGVLVVTSAHSEQLLGLELKNGRMYGSASSVVPVPYCERILSNSVRDSFDIIRICYDGRGGIVSRATFHYLRVGPYYDKSE